MLQHIHRHTGRMVVLLLLLMSFANHLHGQITTLGSRPTGLDRSDALRSAILLPTLRVGYFDKDSAYSALSAQEERLLRTARFAHKQHVDVDVIASASHRTAPAGEQVWQYRVSSDGAASIGLYFDEFWVPEGALLFVYDLHGREILGGFGAENIQPGGGLGLVPIFADDVVIEVVAPHGSATPRLHLSEVNHGLIDLRTGRAFGKDYMGTAAALSCTPEVVCFPDLGQLPQSVVLILIDGVGMGTGVMVNNTRGDQRPLLLTAAHVVSSNFKTSEYEQQASRVQVVFNYKSPGCTGEVQPSITQTVSGATLVGVDESHDVCLLELNNRPPATYQVQYAGWNAEGLPTGPFTNIHHPRVQPMSVNLYYGSVALTTFPSTTLPFDANVHLRVAKWDIGTTASGSSGSPLFDGIGRVVGCLSGGRSYCETGGDDFFYSLAHVATAGLPGTQRVMAALDPSGTQLSCDALSSAGTRYTRISHINEQFGEVSLEQHLPQLPRQDLIGHGTSEILERYMLRSGTRLSGVYIVFDTAAGQPSIGSAPATTTLRVISGDSEQRVLLSQVVDLQSIATPPSLSTDKAPRFREVYVPLTEPLTISTDGAVYLGLSTANLPSHMSVVHKWHQGDVAANTLYHRVGGALRPATETIAAGTSNNDEGQRTRAVSLWVDPMVHMPQASEAEEMAPLMLITPLGASQMLVSFAPRTEGVEKSLGIYTLLGQPIYHHRTTDMRVLLPRTLLQGKGIVVVTVRAGGEKLGTKIYVPQE